MGGEARRAAEQPGTQLTPRARSSKPLPFFHRNSLLENRSTALWAGSSGRAIAIFAKWAWDFLSCQLSFKNVPANGRLYGRYGADAPSARARTRSARYGHEAPATAGTYRKRSPRSEDRSGELSRQVGGPIRLPGVGVDLNRFELGDVIEAGYSKRHRVALRGQRDIPLEAEDHGTLSVAPDSNNLHLGSNVPSRK